MRFTLITTLFTLLHVALGKHNSCFEGDNICERCTADVGQCKSKCPDLAKMCTLEKPGEKIRHDDAGMYDHDPSHHFVGGDEYYISKAEKEFLENGGVEPSLLEQKDPIKGKLWTNNVMKYKFASGVPSRNRDWMMDSFREISEQSCVSFQDCGSGCSGNYVEIKSDEDKCFSSVGMRGGKQTIMVGSNCMYGASLHETLHALGFMHEQSRPDRDSYVTVHTENADSASTSNFMKYQTSNWGHTGSGHEAYDYSSIMHYGKSAFSKNGKETIVTKNGADIGQRCRLSASDLKQINDRYSCPTSTRTSKLSKQHGGSYGRGVGTVQVPSCRSNEDLNGLLCYPKCRSGYSGSGPVCWQTPCPPGFRNDGAFCAKPSSYGRGWGRSPCTGCTGCSGCSWRGCSGCSGCSSCSTSRCRSNEQGYGALCYPRCRSGFHNFGCCVCSPDCKNGMTDIGASCVKKSYGRGAGRIPSYGCPSGKENDDGLCYKPCALYYNGVGPVCWWSTCDLWADQTTSYQVENIWNERST